MTEEAPLRDQHIQEVLAQGRARAASSTAWLEQSDQLLRRGKAQLDGQQATPPDDFTHPPTTAAPPGPAASPPATLHDPAPLRRHLAETFERLAQTESRMAQVHDQMASQAPDNAAQLRQIADEADNKPAEHSR